MAKLNKRQYEYRNESAFKKMKENKENENLTEDQHNILAEICKKRHELHCLNSSVFYFTENQNYDEYIELVTDLTGEENNFLNLIKKTGIDYNIDSILSVMREFEFENNDSYHEGLDDLENVELKNEEISKTILNYSNLKENLNNEIEKFLKFVDENYSTYYCPTGFLRN